MGTRVHQVPGRGAATPVARRFVRLFVSAALVGGLLFAAPASADTGTGGAAPPSSSIPPPPDLLNLSEIDAPPATPQVVVGDTPAPVDTIGTGEFYATPAQIGSLQDFEEQAVEDTVDAHDFATGDYDTVLSWDRDDADAMLFALIDDAMTTSPGDTIAGESLITATDVENVDAWFSTAMQRQDLAAAQEAGLEYTRWAGLGVDNYLSLLDGNPSETAVQDFLSETANTYTDGYSPSNPPTVETATTTSTPGYDADGGYCVYEPPSPDQGQYEANIFHDNTDDVAPQLCFSGCSSIEGCPPPTPSLASFQNWGAADLTAKESSQAYVDQLRSVSTGAAVLSAISAAAIPAGVAIPAALPTAALAPLAGSAFQQAVFPFAARPYFTGSGGASGEASEATESADATEAGDVAEGEAATDAAEGAVDELELAGGAVAATGVGVLVSAVLFALATSIQEGITIIGGEAVPGELAQTIVPSSPPAIDLPAIAADPTQLTAAYGLFLQATAPAPTYSACLNTTETDAVNGAAFTVPGIGDSSSNGLSDGDYLPLSGSGGPGATYAPCGNQTPVPAQSASDPDWLVTPSGGGTTTTTPDLTFDYDTPTTPTAPASTTTTTAYLSGNWLVATASPDGVNSATVQTARLSYTDWSGQAHVAEIYDDSPAPYFIDITSDADSPTFDPSTCVADGTCSVTSTIEAVDGNGNDITVGVTPSTRDTSIALSPECYLGGCYSPPAPLPPSTSPITFPNPGTESLPLTVTTSPSVPIGGEPVTLTATLPQAEDSGTVTFSDAAGQLCDAVPLTEDDIVTTDPVTISLTVNGVASQEVIYETNTIFQSGASCITQLPAGDQTVTADYSGGNTLGLATAPTVEPATDTVPITVVNPTTTTLGQLPREEAVGTPFTVTATVSDPGGPAPTGAISFLNGAKPLCTVAATPDPANPGTSTGACQIVGPMSVGDALLASYAGDASTGTSKSLVSPVIIIPTPVSLTLRPAVTDPVVGQPVLYTATLAVPVDAAPPVGVLQFSAGEGGQFDCRNVPLVSAGDVGDTATYTATCTGTFLDTGTVDADASYSGDNNTEPGQARDTSVTVGPASTSVALALTSIDGVPAGDSSPAAGQPVEYTATVTALSPSTGGLPLGDDITFTSGDTILCATHVGPDGVATCRTTAGAPGTPPVTATYDGDDMFLGSSATINPTVTNPSSVTTLATSDPDPVVGEPVTYTASVVSSPSDATPPSGVVVFYAGDGEQCAVSLTSDVRAYESSCTIVFASPTSTQVSAEYLGSPDGTVLGSSDMLDVDVSPVPSTTSVTPSAPTAVVGQPVTYTATVSPSPLDTAGPPLGGTVTFVGASGPVCPSEPLIAGSAMCTTSFAAAGDPTVTAEYSGDPDTVGSDGQVALPVGPATSNTVVTSSAPPPVVGKPVTFTATVVDLAPDTLGPNPTGAVTFSSGSTTLCADVPLGQAGTATCTDTFRQIGPETVTATYLGDSGSLGSTGSVGVTVGPDWTGPAAAGLTGVQAHDRAGFYLGLEPGTANRWELFATQPTASPARSYSGTITVDRGAFGGVGGVKLEPVDTVTFTPGTSTISFSFRNKGRLDGVAFTTPTGATRLTLDLDINGVEVAPSSVRLGPSRQPPAAVPVVVSR